jgi:hypothetical protein
MPSSDGLTVHLSKTGSSEPILPSHQDPAKAQARTLDQQIVISVLGQRPPHQIYNNARVHTSAVPETRQRDKAHLPRNLQRLCSLTAVPGQHFTLLITLPAL